jgi:hypothetical protein
MPTRLDILLDPLTPELDRALAGDGFRVPVPGGGALRIREAPQRLPVGPEEAAPQASPRGPSHPALRRDRAEEVVVGFTPRQARPPPAVVPPPTPRPEREGVRTISVSRDEPTRDEKRQLEEIQRRVPFERVREVLAMAPSGAASSSELAAWFGVSAAPLEALLRSWLEGGSLESRPGGRFGIGDED